MGETAVLQGARAGQFVLNDWLGQQDNAATPQGIVPFILPVQEMRPFQRTYKFSSGRQTLAIGEVVSLVWRVPEGEYWKILGVFWENGDNVDHSLSVNFTINPSLLGDQGGAISIYRAALINVAGGASKVIYGLNIQTRTNTDLYHQFLDISLQPTDAISITMGEVVAAGGAQSWTMLYELMPGVPERRNRGLPALRVVT